MASEDLKRYLGNKQGVPQKERETIARDVMNLRYAKNEDEFRNKRLTVEDRVLISYPDMTDYLGMK